MTVLAKELTCEKSIVLGFRDEEFLSEEFEPYGTVYKSSDNGTIGVKGTVMRERVCIMEIWVECFGKERQNLKKADSYEIEGILNKIGGWKKYDSNTTGKTKVPLYGVQKTFVRMDEKPEETR